MRISKQLSKLRNLILGNPGRPQQPRRHRLRSLLIEQMEDRRLLTTIDLAALVSGQGTTICGADVGDRSGYSVSSAGDVNGDGFDDLLIGAYAADASGNAKSTAGDSYVIFGGASLPATIDLATLGAAGITIFGADASDGSGRSVSSAGDVNGDGFDDLLIGAYLADAAENLKASSGDNYLIFGGASPPQTIDLATLSPSEGVTIFGADAGDRSGVSVSSAGDVNGDGFDDLLIGAYRAGASGNGKSSAGDSYLIFGGPSLPPTIDLATLGQSGQPAGVTIFGAGAGDRSGLSVSNAGDVNGDGFDDLLIGAYRAGASGNLKLNAGDTYVIFGGPSLPQTIDLDTLAAEGVTIFGANTNDNSGRSVSSAGDVNGDGFDDLLIGAHRSYSVGNFRMYAGESYVIFGAASLPQSIDLATLGQVGQPAGVTIFGAEMRDRSGGSVSAAGDVNGDGFDDLLIGAYRADSGLLNSRRYAGETYLIFGGPSLPQTIDLATLDQLGQSAGVTVFGAGALDNSGLEVSDAGDVNGDGFDDLLIGARGGDAAGNNKSNAGDSYVIFGKDFAGSVTHQGTETSETLTGDTSANVMVGGRGNDTLIGSGGVDVLRGGEGDDILAISDLSFSRAVGGNGFDTLRLDGSGLHLDLTTIADNRILGVEQIDITGSGDNTLTLNVQEVLNLSDESNSLVVRRNAGDTVNFGSGWTSQPDELIGGVNFNVVTQGAATLKIQATTTNQSPTDIALSSLTLNENLPVASAVGVLSTTDPDAGDTFTYSFVSGAGSTDNASFTLDGTTLRTATALDFETKSSYSVRIRTTDQGGFFYEEAFTISVLDLPELVGSAVVGDGTIQRSLVNQLQVTFDGAITISSGAFSVVKQGTNGGPVTTAWATSTNGNGQTVVTLTFTGTLTRGPFNALSDGNYILNIDGTKITRAGRGLDANKDGVGGDSYSFGNNQAVDKFFALYGDTNGDGVVNVVDRAAFSFVFLQASRYRADLDFNGDGVINVVDRVAFSANFLKTVT